MRIEFIIPTWNRPENLMVVLSSLVVQTNPNWTAHVIIDGMTNDYFNVKSYFQKYPNIRFSHIDGPNRDWGHSARNFGLDEAQEEWLCMTGDDNYYVPTFVELMFEEIKKGPVFVFCDLVHNLAFGGYQHLSSTLKESYIDIGNFIFKKDGSKDIRLDKTSYQADFQFITDYLNKMHVDAPDVIKIPKILYVHN